MIAPGIFLLLIGIPLTALGLARRRPVAETRYTISQAHRTYFKGAGWLYFALGGLCLISGVSLLLS